MTPSPGALVVTIAAVVAAGAAPALAQATGSPAPSSGLFGGGASRAAARQKLDVTVSLAAAYDSDESMDANQLLGVRPTAHSNMFVGAADYDWGRQAVQVRANAASTLRHDRLSGDISSINHWALAGFTARLPRRTTLFVSQSATYSPSYLYTLFPRVEATAPGEVPPSAPDSPASDFESYSYGSQLTLTHDFSRRSRFSAIAESNQTDYRGATAGQPELSWYGMTGLVALGVKRNTRATARYRYRAGNFENATGAATPGISTEHGVEIGVVHSRPLSGTRRMTFDLGLGGSVVLPPAAPAGESRHDGSYRLVGQTGLSYSLGRAWLARAMYQRGVDYVPGFTEPVSTDGVTARIDGLITRRVDVLVSATYASGESVWNRNAPAFDTYAGDARLRFALARGLALYAEYVYYFYDFGGTTQLAPGMPHALERHGVRAGLTLRVPALER